MRFTFVVLSELCQLLLDRFPWHFVQTFMSFSGWIVITLLILWLFIWCHHQIRVSTCAILRLMTTCAPPREDNVSCFFGSGTESAEVTKQRTGHLSIYRYLHLLQHARYDSVSTHLAATLQLNSFPCLPLSLSLLPLYILYAFLSDEQHSSRILHTNFSQNCNVSNRVLLIHAKMCLPCPEPTCIWAQKKVNWLRCGWCLTKKTPAI